MPPKAVFEARFGRAIAEQGGKTTTPGVPRIHGRALVAAATLGALMSLERAARAECAPDAACPATSSESSAAPAPTPPVPPTTTGSSSLLTGGIVLTSVGTLAIVVAGGAALAGGMDCALASGSHEDVGGGCPVSPAVPIAALSGIVFVAVGIPLIVVGANQRRHPQPSKVTASVCPWLAPRVAGLGLRLEL
jgi:hypothetical protein